MIQLTQAAIDKIKKEQPTTEESDVDGVRIAVNPGGCSGFQKTIYFDYKADDDLTVEYDGLLVLVDPESAPFFEGVTVDYKEALQGAAFDFQGMQVQRECGCGKSFS